MCPPCRGLLPERLAHRVDRLLMANQGTNRPSRNEAMGREGAGLPGEDCRGGERTPQVLQAGRLQQELRKTREDNGREWEEREVKHRRELSDQREREMKKERQREREREGTAKGEGKGKEKEEGKGPREGAVTGEEALGAEGVGVREEDAEREGNPQACRLDNRYVGAATGGGGDVEAREVTGKGEVIAEVGAGEGSMLVLILGLMYI